MHAIFLSRLQRLTLVLIAALTMTAGARAVPTAPEAEMIRTLDRAFRPGLLETRAPRKHADGTYSKVISTGDAIARDTIGTPLKALREACGASHANLALVISAGKTDGHSGPQKVRVGGEDLSIDRNDMWNWFSDNRTVSAAAASRGFRALLPAGPFLDRATARAESDPPFGLFACRSAEGEDLWAAAIMPIGTISAYDASVKVVPLTGDWLAQRQADRARKIQAQERAALEAEQASTRRAREAEFERRRVEAEEQRLKPFRASLAIGSRTNCGLIIAMRGPLVQVQLPPNILGPGGTREFWTDRSRLTDAAPPKDCRFGG